MTEEKEKCNCGCPQGKECPVSEQEVVEKMKKRNLIAAVILLILAILFAVWNFWGENYMTECRYKSSLAEELQAQGINYTDIEVQDSKYIVTLQNGATLTFSVSVDPEANTYSFEIDEKRIIPPVQ